MISGSAVADDVSDGNAGGLAVVLVGPDVGVVVDDEVMATSDVQPPEGDVAACGLTG